MTRISIFFVLLVCLFVPGVSIAGSAGGLFLFIIPMESNLSEKTVIDNYFKKNYGVDNALSPTCEITYHNKIEHARPMVDVFYLKTPVNGINETLLRKSIENDKDKNKLMVVLSKFRDDIVWNGFDAILFYNNVNDIINFYSISAIYKTMNVQNSSIAAADVLDDKKLGQAICKVLAKLPTPAP
ncbi:hypothetical protein [Lelliottia sp. WB101]|uniref:hypothetical protein n=1 Tax=Lelliottia sp. WB101 TaxID=2153385 RepID=UPI00131ED1F7|nr:hypothetical protein [Lelliottia sp. WB101]